MNLERGISGTATLVLSNADYPLSASEGQAFVLILTGTVTDDLALIVPQESRVYVVDNRCTIVGTHSITMRPPVGGGVTVETGYQRALMYCDGSNVYPVASGTAAGGGSGAPTDATYLVGSAHALLSGERVVTDTSTITWDLATAGQARALIPPDAVSYTHLQNVSSSRILGRFTGGAGDVQEITPGTGLALDGATGVLSATAVGQPLDATLTALAGLATGADQLPYATGTDTFLQTTLTPFARTLLDDVSQAAAQGTLGVVPGTHVQAQDATLTALAGVTTGIDTLPFFTGVDTASTTTLTAFMRGLLDDPDAATARSTLGVTGGGGGSSDFLGLSDTPDSYSGQASKVVSVKADATGLEFVTGGGAAAVPFRGCVLKRSTLATGINASTLYTVLWDSEDYDTDTLHSTGTNPARITVPSGVTRLQVSAGLRLSNVSGTTGVAIYIRKNGTTNVSSSVHGAMGYTDAGSSLISPVLSVVAGDYFEVLLLCSDASVDIQADADNYFACAVVEPYAVGSGTAYTDEQAQDAVGTILGESATIDLTYTDATPSITAAVVDGSIGTTQLANDAVTYAKLQTVTDARLLGRSAGSAGDAQEITVGTGLSLSGGALTNTVSAGQPLDATLTALAGLATGANQLPYATGTDTFAQTTLSAYIRTLLDDADAATARGTLLLGTMAQQDASAVAITGGSATFSGNVQANQFVGIGTAPDSFYSLKVGYGAVILHDKATRHGLTLRPTDADTGAATTILFNNVAAGIVGSITTTATTTAYNTSSDVRLKRKIHELLGGVDAIKRMRPVSYAWNSTDEPDIGFLAHELMTVAPNAVTGQPDEVNPDGSVKPQQVDQSKLVPILVAAVKELLARVETLEAQLA